MIASSAKTPASAAPRYRWSRAALRTRPLLAQSRARAGCAATRSTRRSCTFDAWGMAGGLADDRQLARARRPASGGWLTRLRMRGAQRPPGGAGGPP
eukprot:10842973-Alexandrium_andersonii.AAC.1